VVGRLWSGQAPASTFGPPLFPASFTAGPGRRLGPMVWIGRRCLRPQGIYTKDQRTGSRRKNRPRTTQTNEEDVIVVPDSRDLQLCFVHTLVPLSSWLLQRPEEDNPEPLKVDRYPDCAVPDPMSIVDGTCLHILLYLYLKIWKRKGNLSLSACAPTCNCPSGPPAALGFNQTTYLSAA
jgi:hypothetical protein